MKVHTILYSLKVWATSVFVAPVLFFIASALRLFPQFNGMFRSFFAELTMYPVYVLFGLVLSFVTWLIFWFTIAIWELIPFTPLVRTWFICLTGILLTIITFIATLIPVNFFNVNNNDFILMLSNCICIGFGTWYFKLQPESAC